MDDLTAPPPEPAIPTPEEPAPSRRRHTVAILVGAVAALAIVVGTALVVVTGLLRGTGDVVDRMVPGDAGVYATAYLDPSLSQKLDLQALVRHIPALQGQQVDRRLDQGMDGLLKPEGLSFATDVRPWLGSQVAVAARLTEGTPSVLIVASKDDARATATLARIRRTDTGARDRWSEQAHGGVTVSVGTPVGDRGTPLAYAYLDHAAGLGTSAAIVDDVIDTDQGRRSPLRASADYSATLQRLPAERIGLAYVSGPAVTGALRRRLLGGDDIVGAAMLGTLDHRLDAVRSAGLALSAQRGGVAADLAVVTDITKLDPATRRALQSIATANPALDWVPSDAAGLLAASCGTVVAAGLLAAGGLRETLHALTEGMGAAATATPADLGLPLAGLPVDPREALTHLDGNLALEVRAAPGSPPGGALVTGIDDERAVRSLLSRLVGAIAGTAWPQTATYRGTTITSLPVPGLGDAGVAPAYAVLDGVAVMGSSPSEVRAAIDAHAGGTRITGAPGFTAAGAYAPGSPVLYLDLQRIRAAVERALPAEMRPEYDRDLRANLAALRSLRITRQGSGAEATERAFLAIG